MFPLEVFCTPKKMWVFLNKEVFPIGISLCVRIRGTRLDSKSNLLISIITNILTNVLTNILKYKLEYKYSGIKIF